MKKHTWIMLVLVCTGLLSSCAKSTIDPIKKAEEEGRPRTRTVGATMGNFSSIYMTRVRDSMQAYIDTTNFEIEAVNSKDDAQIQEEQIATFFEKKADALILNMKDTNLIWKYVERAQEEKVPLIFLRSRPSKSIMEAYSNTWYVGSKKSQGQMLRGEILAEYIEENNQVDKNEDESIQYILVSELVKETSEETVEENKEPTLLELAMEESDYKADKIKSISKSEIQELKEEDLEQAEAVICENDKIALSVVEHMKEKRDNGEKEPPFIPIVGFGGSQKALEAIKQGAMLGTVSEDPKNQGIAAAKLAILAKQKKEINEDNLGYVIADEKYVWIDYVKITKDNYKEYLK